MNKVLVYQDRVEIYVNALPNSLLGALGMDVDAETLQNGQKTAENGQKEKPDETSDSSLPAKTVGLRDGSGSLGWI
ncbi:MAG: hypothetical protein FWD58_09920 [Firmicutes bacterium]|nr:hypothetical protein [Bacillota bacterium]